MVKQNYYRFEDPESRIDTVCEYVPKWVGELSNKVHSSCSPRCNAARQLSKLA
jgi:hypothetical protein